MQLSESIHYFSQKVKMRRNCNLELRLSPPSSLHSSDRQSSLLHRHRHPKLEESSNDSPQNQQITIFYNGRVCISDVTDLQAKAIMMLAAREMEEKLRTPTGSEPSSPDNKSQPSVPTNHSLHMKRSLQTFLQKRKNRIQAASPYHHQ